MPFSVFFLETDLSCREGSSGLNNVPVPSLVPRARFGGWPLSSTVKVSALVSAGLLHDDSISQFFCLLEQRDVQVPFVQLLG